MSHILFIILLFSISLSCISKDAENKTPLHHAIENGHNPIISLLLSHPALDLSLRDKSGITPFAAAMSRKNNKAAQAILSREPKAAEQVRLFICVFVFLLSGLL